MKIRMALAAGLLAAAVASNAQAVPLANGNYLDVTVGSATTRFTVANCSIDNTTACPGAASLELVQDGTNLGVKIQSSISATDLVPAGGDLSFDLTVSSNQPLSQLILNWSGSGAFSSAGDTISGTSPGAGISADIYTTQVSASFAPTLTFTNSNDFTADSPGAVTWVTEDVSSPVPEPASLSLLGFGCLAIVLSRPRRA